MPMDRFLIGPTGGLETDLKPFMIPDDAMAVLDNAYVFRGRTRKRFGTRYVGGSALSSRLAVPIGAANAATLPNNAQLALGQAFSVGTDIFTINRVGSGVSTLSTNPLATATINSTSSPNTVTFTGEGSAMAYWYPSLPVMGLITYENGVVANEPTFAFDTQYAYQYTGGVWTRISNENASGDASWIGNNSQFFWGVTWSGVSVSSRNLFVTNGNPNETNYMRYYDGTKWWSFHPAINKAGSLFLNSCRIMAVFKNRLLCFNTWEGASYSSQINYQNRCRYSWIGDPTNQSTTGGWVQDIPGGGSAIDAPVSQAIITIEFVKDRLIVFFEQSTWELVYTGNQIYPFAWQQINTELGAESTFSVVPFDKVAIAVGNVGIMACNGSNVERIDEKVPQEVFQIHDTDSGVLRVNGIRDYYVEMIYWTFPDTTQTAQAPYCKKVLVFNYRTGSWAFNDDSFTVFGYIQPQKGVTWDSNTVTWDSDITWDSGSAQALFRQVMAGNQEGYLMIVDADQPSNEFVLQVTDVKVVTMASPPLQVGAIVVTCVDHNFNSGDFVQIQGFNGLTPIAPYTSFEPIFQVGLVVDANNFTIMSPALQASLQAGQTYIGGGSIARASQINITTKQFNFYAKQGRNAYVQKVDFLVDSTDYGEMEIEFYTNTANIGLVEAGLEQTDSILGDGILETSPYALYPYEQYQSQLWHPVYLQADGEYIQLQIWLNNEQMLDPLIVNSQFQLHQMIFHATPTASRLQ